MEIKIGDKGRMTLPLKMQTLLGIREGDVLEVKVCGKSIVLVPRGKGVEETRGIAKVGKVKIEEIEEAAGREL